MRLPWYIKLDEWKVKDRRLVVRFRVHWLRRWWGSLWGKEFRKYVVFSRPAKDPEVRKELKKELLDNS